MQFYTRFNPPPKVGQSFIPVPGNPKHPDNSRTDPTFKDEVDVNKIYERAMRNGGFLTDPLRAGTAKPMFDDFAEYPDDLQTVENQLIDARSRFMALPSELRDSFGNDPHKLLAAVKDPSKRAVLEKYGILTPKTEILSSPNPFSAGKQGDGDDNISGEVS